MERVRISLILILCVLLFGVMVGFVPSAYAAGSENGALTAAGHRDDPGDPPAIGLDPNAIEVDLFTGAAIDTFVTVTNNSDAAINFTVEAEITREGRDGPGRDEAGELLGQFNGINAANQYSSCVGWDWDNERMWVTNYISATAAAYSHDNGYDNFEEEIRINPGNCMDGMWADGLFFVGSFGGNSINRYDVDGRNIGALNFPWGVYGLAWDMENDWMFALSGNDMLIYVFQMDGNGGANVNQPIGVIRNHLQFHGNQTVYGLEWVNKHPDGQLWMTSPQDARVHQILVNTDNWSCTEEVQAFQVFPGADQPYSSVGHDGHNLWASGYAPNTIRVYDDGVTEMYWLLFAPEEGTIQANESMDLSITLNAAGLNEGTYAATIHFRSDDREDPDAQIDIVLNVDGAPDIEVTWDEEYGYPNSMDWNELYLDLFCGGPYTFPFTIQNVGTAELTISGISADNEYFTSDADAFTLAIDEERVVTLTVNIPEDQPGVYEPLLTISTDDDPDEREIDFQLHAEASLPPIIELDQNAWTSDELYTGDVTDVTLNIANDGDALLRWESDIVIIREGDGGRDANARAIRGLRTPSTGPRRDEVDLNGMRFAFFETNNGWNNGMAQGFKDASDLLDDNNCDVFRNAEDWNNVNFDDYDVVCINGYNQPWDQQYQDNLERFEDYVSSGGGAYYETANVEAGIPQPGGIDNDNQNSDSNGILVVSPDEGADNYSILADLFHQSQPDFWNEGEVIEGSAFLHSGYNEQQFIDRVDDGTIEWYQIQAIGQRTQVPGVVAYGFGGGAVLTVGHPVGYGEVNFRAAGQWHSMCAEILFYLSEAGGGGWVSMDPTNGTIDGGSDQNVNIHFDSFGCTGGEWVADIHILSNDPNPERRDLVFTVTMVVIADPDINVEWEAVDGYPEVVDWNRRYQDLFTNGPYDMFVTVENEGGDDLTIDAFTDHEYFTVSPENTVIGIDEKLAFRVTFNAPMNEPDEYTTDLHFTTNDHDEGEWVVPLHALASLPPIIVLEADSVRFNKRTGEVEDYALGIANEGDAILRWQAEIVTTLFANEPQDRDGNGRAIRSLSGAPLRDDAGDLLGRFNGINAQNSYCSPVGWDYDNERMWVTSYNNGIAAAYSHDANYENFEEVARLNGIGNNMDACMADGYFFVPNGLGGNVLNRYDADGQNIGGLNFGFGIYGLAWDMDEDWLFVISSNDMNIHVFQLDGEGALDGGEIGVINNHLQFHANQTVYGLEWVSKHPDGQLWMTSPQDQRVHQILVNTDDWTCVEEVQAFQVFPGADQPYSSIAHDGKNIWVGGYAAADIRVFDDGTDEISWIAIVPDLGEVQAQTDTDVNVHFDAAGLFTGAYSADIIFTTNDPASPVVVFQANMEVVGAPDIDVTWDEAAGYPESINWNGIYGDELYAGGPYPIEITIANVGTDDLEINDLYCDNGVFSTNWDPDRQRIVGADEEIMIIATLESENPGNLAGNLIVECNDDDEANLSIGLRGVASNPPTLTLSLDSTNDSLVTGEVSSHELEIGNDGDAILRFATDIEILQQPGDRDAQGRGIRSLSGAPLRDDAGELLGRFNGVNAANTYCSPVGWDYDNERMWVTQYNNAFAVAYTHDNNYENFEEVARLNGIGNNMDGCMADGLFMVPNSLGGNVLNRYDADGQNIGGLNFGFGIYGLAWDMDEDWLFVISSNDMNIHVFQLDGNGALVGGEMGVIRNHLQFHANQTVYGLEWVSKHPDGQLWMTSPQDRRVHQILVDTDDWTCVEEIQAFEVFPAADQPYSSVAHDGHNIWVGGYAAADIRVYDDGMSEVEWVTVTPEEGELRPDNSVVGSVDINAAGLIGGDYIADINFYSNDPVAPLDEVDASIRVTINVTGIPNVDVTPGGPEEEDGQEPPANFGIVYFGYPETINVSVENVGTEELELNDVISDDNNPDFYVNGDDLQGWVLAVGEKRDLPIWLDPAEERGEGEVFATLTFITNDPRYPDGYPVRVVGTALTRPVLVLDRDAINVVLDEGAPVEEVVIDISNDGGSRLDWEANIDVTNQPGRDENGRGIRSLSRVPAGPRRDEVDLDGMLFANFQTNSVWGWLDDGMKQDPLLDENNFHSYRNAADWDNVDFEEYNVICVSAYQQQFNQQYANNLERFEDYIAGGGCAYFETGNTNQAILSPGGIYNDINGGAGNGQLIVSPDPNADNYSLFAEICHESQPNFWREGEVIEGSSWLHATYSARQFDDRINNGTIEWYQPIASVQGNVNSWGAIAYGFGRGAVLTVGHPSAHCWFNYNQEGMWGSIAAEILYYLTEVGGAKWISMEPMEGSIAARGSQNATIMLSTEENIGGRYEAIIYFESNDPANPVQELRVTMTIRGQSVFGSEPESAPFSQTPNVAFPIAYQGFETSTQIMLTNSGSGVYTVNGYSIDGENADDFGIVFDAPFDVNVGARVPISLWFRPNDTGERFARLHLNSDAMNVEGQDVYWDLNAIGMLPPQIYTRPENGIPRVYATSGGDAETTELIIGNAEGPDRDTLTYAIYTAAVEEGRDASSRGIRSLSNVAAGPLRDAAGDSIARFEVRHYGAFGISRDYENEVMWINSCDQRGVVTNFWTGYQWDGEQITGVVADFEVNLNGTPVLGGAYHNGKLYASRWDGQHTLLVYDTEGNALDPVQAGGDDGGNYIMACAVDPEREYLFVSTFANAQGAGDVKVRVFDINDNYRHIGTISNFLNQGGNADFRGRLCWVPDHDAGHLWATLQFRAYQLAIDDEWNWEIVQDFPVTSDVRSPGIGHDGRNLWIGNNTSSPTVTIWDDGNSEGPDWLTLEPSKGSLLMGEEATITLTCTPGELSDGLYEGRLLIKSNDPGNREFYLGVSMEINPTGAAPLFHFAGYDADNFPNGWQATGSDLSLLVNNVLFEDQVAPAGWEIGVFTPGGVLSGGAAWTGGDPVGMAVYGAEGNVAQFHDGEEMAFRLWDNNADMEYRVVAELREGSLNWSNGGFTSVNLIGRSVYECVVPFGAGWNLISINVTPPQDLWNNNGPDIRRMMSQFRIDEGHHHLILMKNEAGNFYAPANRDFNNIPFWDVAQGYQVRMDQAQEGHWTGVQIEAGTGVDIAAGWNMIAYYPTYQLTCARNTFIAISDIVDNVILTKDGFGHFASPPNNFSNMDAWREGRGFQIKVNQAVVLNYPAQQQNAAAIQVGESDASVVGHWAAPVRTGANMSVLVTGISGADLAAADQVAAFNANGRLVGLGSVTDGMVGLAVWGDDASTEVVDGLLDKEAFTLKLWDADKKVEIGLNMGDLAYETDGFVASDAVAGRIIPDVYSLGQNFPNPFNAVTKLSFGMPEASRVSIRVFDIAGREVATLVSGNLEAGNHTAVWNAEGFNSGVYLVKMETPSFSDVRKVTLIK